MAENNTGILEELKKATEQVQKVEKMDAKQRTEYLEEVSKQFLELQKTVYRLLSKEEIIFNNFEWKWIEHEENELKAKYAIEKKAKEFAMKYGFCENTVLNIFNHKNDEIAYTDIERRRGYIFYYMLVPKE